VFFSSGVHSISVAPFLRRTRDVSTRTRAGTQRGHARARQTADISTHTYMYTHVRVHIYIYIYIWVTSPARVRDGPSHTGCSRATVLCLSSFGGGDLPSRTEGMKTCAGSRRLLLRRERWGRVLRTVHPLELAWSTIPGPSAHPPRSPRPPPPATVIVEGDAIPGVHT